MKNLVPFDDLRAIGITASRSTVWRLERAGQFPKRIQVSPNRVAWLADELQRWIADKVAARDAGRNAA